MLDGLAQRKMVLYEASLEVSRLLRCGWWLKMLSAQEEVERNTCKLSY